MASDADARDFTLNYEGGSLTMPLGNIKNIFGDDFVDLSPEPETVKVTVSGRTVTRVIGGPSKQLVPFSYEYKQWPTSEANNAAAGKVCIFTWTDSDGDWQGRVTGSMSDLGSYLNDKSPKTINFRTQRGTKYGPFKKAS